MAVALQNEINASRRHSRRVSFVVMGSYHRSDILAWLRTFLCRGFSLAWLATASVPLLGVERVVPCDGCLGRTVLLPGDVPGLLLGRGAAVQVRL